jgi:type I restriction enzyme, S subunit
MKLVPKLRFRDFSDNWQKRKLEAITEKVNSGKTPLGGESVYVNSGILFIRSQNVLDSKLSLENSTYITEEVNSTMKNSIVKAKDILLNITGASLGRSCVVPNDFTIGNVNQHVCIVRLNKDNDPYFLQPIFASEKGQNLFTSLQTGSGREGLNFQSIKNLSLLFPSLPEQQKIASFLSAIDEKIQQLTRKKELLELYKKGVMQRLFMSELGFLGLEDDRITEDETNLTILSSKKSQFRQLRFKDENGKAYPKREEKLYEDIFSFYTTNSFSRENLNYETGQVKNIHYGDIHTKFSSRFEVREEVVPYINANVDLSKVKEESYCQEGDLVIADASEDYADIGKTIELIKLNKEKVVAGLHTFLARPNKIRMFKGFSGYLVQAPYVRKQVMTIAQGTKVLSLSPSRLGKVKLEIPCLEEQLKIASYLSSLDTKIESVATQITQSQTFKKGLLQQMFV